MTKQWRIGENTITIVNDGIWFRVGRWRQEGIGLHGQYMKRFGWKSFWHHIKGLYIFRRVMKDSIIKALYLAIKYAGTL